VIGPTPSLNDFTRGKGAAGPETQHYVIEGRQGSDDYTVTVEMTDALGRLSTLSADGKRHYEASLDSGFRTLSFHSVDAHAGTDAHARFAGGRLHLTGRLNGQPMEHSARIAESSFFHYFNVQLRPFVLSSEKRCVFITLRPDTMKPLELEAVKEELRVMPVAGSPCQVWVVRIRPTGLLALFWSTHVYFRAEEGVFVLDEGKDVAGRPMVSRLVNPEPRSLPEVRH
jgi:hypothetical protein